MKKEFWIIKNKGFYLLEIMLASAVFTLVLTAFAGGIFYNLNRC
jgi:type II secretory pathway pseudopilin PulG